MAKFRVKTNQFCSLSRENKWQGWLQSIAPDLHKDLMKQLEVSVSCKANQSKMIEIYQALEQKNLGLQVIKFLRREYPHTVEEILEPRAIATPTSLPVPTGTQEVFSHYNPNLLTFPQKMILQNDDIDALKKDTHTFLADKVGGDYLIIGNKSYIEFFKLKYSQESHMIRMVDRELVKYRGKNNIPQGVHVIEQK